MAQSVHFPDAITNRCSGVAPLTWHLLVGVRLDPTAKD